MFSYLEVNTQEKAEIVRILLSYLDYDKSRIVKVCSIQTLADLAERDESIKPKVESKLKEIVEAGRPAMKKGQRNCLQSFRQERQHDEIVSVFNNELRFAIYSIIM